VFSVFRNLDGEPIYNRTVSANLGMSYSICNVLTEAKIENICRWIPFEIDDFEVRNRMRNKMIRPTTIPQTLEDLQIEQAVAREALRLAFEHHKSLARGLKGVQTQRDIGEALTQAETGATLVKMINLNMIIGSGGVLSHAPMHQQSALMLLDAYQPEGITMLAKDSIFMMPQLGILSTLYPEPATQVFEKDCLIKFGDCVCPVGTGREGEVACELTLDGKSHIVKVGEILRLPEYGLNQKVEARIKPGRNFDLGAGRGREITTQLEGGTVGIIVDGRGRPLNITNDKTARVPKLRSWLKAMGIMEA
jgi:hypothetical protein